MTAPDIARSGPPDAEPRFDIGAPDVLERMIELFARHGDIYRLYMPARRSWAYVIHHPDDVKRVLVTHHRNYTKGVDRDRIKVLLGLGIMTSDGELWQRQRHMMQPFFHHRVIERFAEVIGAANDRLLDRWEARSAQDQAVNITQEMSELTLEIMLRTLFGSDAEELIEPFSIVTREPARNLEFVYKFRALGSLVAQLIRKRRREEGSGAERFDFLSMLMAARDRASGEPMPERQLIDEVMTLVVAGHETTASVLNWTWYLLSEHSEVDARLFEILTGRPCSAAPSLAALEALPYPTQVLNEAMRLYPPGWLLSRRSIQADVLCGCEIPPGADVLIPLYLLHRHPRYWPDPDRFDPERFSPEREPDRPRFAFMPFAAGPRHCIGETLAMYEMLVHLEKVVPRFRLTLIGEPPIGLEAQINLRNGHPFRMRLIKR